MGVSAGGAFTAAEAAAMEWDHFDCTWRGIVDLTGIEFFTGLHSLNCSDNELTHLDLSQNQSLTNFACGRNQIATLILPNSPNLEIILCENNELTSIANFVAHPALRTGDAVDVRNNNLGPDDWNDVVTLRDKLGPLTVDEWESPIAGLAYSPQKDYDPYDFTGAATPAPTEIPRTSADSHSNVRAITNVHTNANTNGYAV